MIARPVAATLGCCGCRSTIVRALLSKPTTNWGNFTHQRLRQASGSSQRTFTSGRHLRTITEKSEKETVDSHDGDAESGALKEESTDTPWFLEVEPPRHPPIQHAVDLPKVPDDAPAILGPMMKYIYEDMGLDDLSLLDLRDLDPPAALGANLIMLFGTARSERHLHVSAGRFVRWIRRKNGLGARADGLIGPGELKTKLRRLKKKAKLMGTNANIVPGGDNGISTGWVCVNFSTSGGRVNEDVSFDEEGRFSGFGTSQTGTTIIIQCMTEQKRNELDLETLWRGILKRNLEKTQKLKGESPSSEGSLEALVSSKVQQPSNPAALQWQALQLASQQQRQFSTMARRLQPQPRRGASSEGSRTAPEGRGARSELDGEADSHVTDLSTLHKRISDLQISGTSLSSDTLQNLISASLHAPSPAEDTASERLALVDQLLRVAEERGMKLWSKDWVVQLIEYVVTSPTYGPELQRAQKNLEFLLNEMRSALDHSQTLQLMAAYAFRSDWDRFWDVFRMPARFQVARHSEHYELAYRVMASTGDAKLCTNALRWVYPEMLKEQPPVLPTGKVYEALKACILVADPAAEGLLHHPPPADSLDLLGQRRLIHREFVRVLKEVEDLRNHLVGTQAREERVQALNRISDDAVPASV